MNGPIIRPQNVPTSDQKAALAGTNGSPSASNKFVTNSDPRLGQSGYSGYSGESGVSGYSGAIGMAGGYFLFYSFDTTVGGNPAAGYIRLAGSSDPTTATHLHVSETDHNSVNVDTILDSIAVGDVIKIFCTHDATIYHMFQVTGTFASTGSPPYDPIPVTWLAGGGTLTNELHIGFASATKGASGYSGYSGSGVSGYSGSGVSGESGASGSSGTSGYSGSGVSGYSGYSGIKTLSSPSVNQTADGPSISTYLVGGGAPVNIMDLVYLNSSSQWVHTDADAESTAKGLLAISLQTQTPGNAMNVALPGSIVRNDTWNWTPGATLYVDTATSGQIVATAPSGVDDVVRVVGWALTADVIYFMPSADYITRTG